MTPLAIMGLAIQAIPVFFMFKVSIEMMKRGSLM